MSTLEALVLGAVQGLTEFIPISSSGHLVLVPEALGWDEPGLAFDVLLHAASLIALLIYFSGDLLDLARGFLSRDEASRRMVYLLAVGTIPSAIAGIVLADFFEQQFADADAAAVQLILTAVILVGAEQAVRYHEKRTAQTGASLRTMEDLRTPDALIVGVAQAVSILPGISRSGSTIGAGLALGVERDDSARFAFLLAIPALFGAMLVKLPELADSSLGFGAGFAGFVASLLTSYGAIWGLIRYLKTNTLYPFAVYCVIAGIAFLIAV
ncbi:MAG TPA: undecaprenyl-diphosphate phosphatase [Actinomycetota bacterium]|nr:undecaprenyl-diphosphate phosphatase [Actinomycetota bacterium]